MAATTTTKPSSSSNLTPMKLRTNRLMKELLEIQKCPVPNASVSPLNDENLNEWHGNIRGTENSEWEGIVVHFTITFPSEYPIRPPRVQLFSYIPHLNVQPRNGAWEVCLDMLATQPLGSLTTPYQYWSSAFSVRSILIQMTSFLLAEGQPTQIATGNIQRSRTESSQYQCPTCSHCPTQWHPPFPEVFEIEKAPLSFPCVEVSGETAQHLQSRILQRRIQQHQLYLEKQSHMESTKQSEIRNSEDENNQNENAKDKNEQENIKRVEEDKLSSSNQSIQPKTVKDEEVWQVVGKKSHSSKSSHCQPSQHHNSSSKQKLTSTTSNPVVPQSEPSQINFFSNLHDIGVLMSYKCSHCHKKLKEESFSRSQLNKGDNRKCMICLKSLQQFQSQPSQQSPPATNKPLALIPGASSSMVLLPSNGKSAVKTLNKTLGKKEKKLIQEPKAKVATNSPVEHQVECKNEEKEDLKANAAVDSSTVSLESAPKSEECLGEWKNIWRSSPETSNETNSNMGVFKTLNRDTSVLLLSFLQVNDILSLGACCRGTSSLCDDWLVWRTVLRRTYPRTALTPTGPNSSWKTAYMLEANGLAQDLTCFTSFSTKSDSVLGFPLTYTTNPKTGCLDYATSTFDILSFDSFMQGNVRKTMWGERFTDFLPIYIDEDHFLRGLPQLVRVSRKIIQTGLLNQPKHTPQHNCKSKHHHHGHHHGDIPESGNWMPRNDGEMILTLLTKMMNTQVVLLCDKGIVASEVALMGYCQLHRLLLAVVEHFPHLRVLVRQRLEDFSRKPETRVKAYTPSLGELLALLSVSDTYSWSQLSLAYLGESFDRSVLWACSKDPSLAEVTMGDESRLEKYLTTQRVSLRLTLFHSVFLNLLVQGGGSKVKLDDCADRYDTFQGRPPLYLRREWQKRVKSILEFQSWPEFFAISGIPLPSKPFLLSKLEQAVKNSLKKGYHSKDTVFQNVMKSGVSRILLKGETYSAAPNLKRVELVESWRYDGDTIFLDASCLIYGFNGECLMTIDYSHTQGYTTTPSGSQVLFIEHSGDVIDHNTNKGHHSIHIDMTRIPPCVGALFFTVSAWTTSLREIYQPAAKLFDSVSDTEMCRYKLEDQDTGDKTAVIMCKLHRPSVGARWQLTSIGHVGYGRADNYSPIHSDIKQFL